MKQLIVAMLFLLQSATALKIATVVRYTDDCITEERTKEYVSGVCGDNGEMFLCNADDTITYKGFTNENIECLEDAGVAMLKFYRSNECSSFHASHPTYANRKMKVTCRDVSEAAQVYSAKNTCVGKTIDEALNNGAIEEVQDSFSELGCVPNDSYEFICDANGDSVLKLWNDPISNCVDTPPDDTLIFQKDVCQDGTGTGFGNGFGYIRCYDEAFTANSKTPLAGYNVIKESLYDQGSCAGDERRNDFLTGVCGDNGEQYTCNEDGTITYVNYGRGNIECTKDQAFAEDMFTQEFPNDVCVSLVNNPSFGYLSINLKCYQPTAHVQFFSALDTCEGKTVQEALATGSIEEVQDGIAAGCYPDEGYEIICRDDGEVVTKVWNQNIVNCVDTVPDETIVFKDDECLNTTGTAFGEGFSYAVCSKASTSPSTAPSTSPSTAPSTSPSTAPSTSPSSAPISSTSRPTVTTSAGSKLQCWWWPLFSLLSGILFNAL